MSTPFFVADVMAETMDAGLILQGHRDRKQPAVPVSVKPFIKCRPSKNGNGCNGNCKHYHSWSVVNCKPVDENLYMGLFFFCESLKSSMILESMVSSDFFCHLHLKVTFKVHVTCKNIAACRFRNWKTFTCYWGLGLQMKHP